MQRPNLQRLRTMFNRRKREGVGARILTQKNPGLRSGSTTSWANPHHSQSFFPVWVGSELATLRGWPAGGQALSNATPTLARR